MVEETKENTNGAMNSAPGIYSGSLISVSFKYWALQRKIKDNVFEPHFIWRCPFNLPEGGPSYQEELVWQPTGVHSADVACIFGSALHLRVDGHTFPILSHYDETLLPECLEPLL